MRKLLSILAVAACLVLPSTIRAEGPYEINALLPLTGALAFVGPAEARALLAVETAVNKAGGINGRQIKFVVQDDQTSPQLIVQQVNALIAKNAPMFILGGSTPGCLAVAPLLTAGPVAYCISPSVHPAKDSFLFAIDPVDTDQISVAIRYFNQRGITRFAMITTTDAGGQDAERSVDTALALPENKALQIVDREKFAPSDISVSAQMSHIKASGAQMLIAFSSGTAFGTVLRDASQTGLALPVFTGNANMTIAQMTQYAQFVPAELYFPGFACVVPDQVSDRRLKTAVQAYTQSLIAQGDRPEYMQSTTYDPAMIFVAALRKYGTNITAAQVRDFIANLQNFPAATGIYDFRAYPQRGLGPAAVIVTRWDRSKTGWVAASKPGGAPL